MLTLGATRSKFHSMRVIFNLYGFGFSSTIYVEIKKFPATTHSADCTLPVSRHTPLVCMFTWYPVPALSAWTVILFEIPSKYWSHWRTFWFGAPFRNKKAQRCVNDVEKHLIVNLLTNEAVTWCCLRWTRRPQTHLVQPTIYYAERYYLFAASWWWTSVLHFHMIVPIQLSVYIERSLLIVDGNYVSVMSVCMTVHGVWHRHTHLKDRCVGGGSRGRCCCFLHGCFV